MIRLAALLAAFVFSGCAITMDMHANRFQSPEVEGRLGEEDRLVLLDEDREEELERLERVGREDARPARGSTVR